MPALRLVRLESDSARPAFCCGDRDLNEFFHQDSIEAGKQLLSVTYGFLDEQDSLLAFCSLSNDAVKKEALPKAVWRRAVQRVFHRKRYASMPAVKIGRLGVSSQCSRSGIGSQVLDFLKVWFTRGNKTGCRFLLVDAYNQERVLRFYEKNGFRYLGGDKENDATRIMYFDLYTFRP